MPRCVLMDAYRAVPVKFLFSRYGMWVCVRGSRYLWRSYRPKTYNVSDRTTFTKEIQQLPKEGDFFLAKQWGSVEKEEEKVVNGKGSTYFFAKPKSMMKTWLPRLANPIIKLSGLMSRCKNDLECTYSIRLISWSANNSTVFTVNFREQKLNRSSKDGPSSSITLCSVPRERVVRTRAR